MLALVVRDRPEALDLIDRIQKAQDHLHTLYEDVRGYAAPIKLDTAPVRPRARSGARPGPTSKPPATEKQAAPPSRTTDGVDLRCVGRPVPARAGLPQHPGQRPGRRLAPRSRSRSAPRRPSSTASRRSASPSATTARGSTPSSGAGSSTRSSPPRPRGPAWAWPSPGGSSRPTAAGSPSATRDAPGADLPHHPPARTSMNRAAQDRRRRRRARHARLLPADPAAAWATRSSPSAETGRELVEQCRDHAARPGHHRHQDARHGRHRRRRADLPQRPRSRSSWSRPTTTPSSSAAPRPTTSWPTWSSRSSRPTSSRPSPSPCAGSSSSRRSARRPPT